MPILPEGDGKAKKVVTANLGRSYYEQARAYTIKDATHEAAVKGRNIFIRIGGEVYKIPAQRSGDAVAFITELDAKFRAAETRNSIGKGYPFSAELHYGERGIFIDLDKLDFFSPELRAELGPFSQYQELTAELSEHMARTAGTFLGIRTTGSAILGAWDEAGTTEDEPNED